MFFLDIFTRFSIKRVFSIFCMSRAPIVRRYVWQLCDASVWTTNAYGNGIGFKCHAALHLLANTKRRWYDGDEGRTQILSCLAVFIINMKWNFLRNAFQKKKSSPKYANRWRRFVCRCQFFFLSLLSFCYQKNVTWNLLKFFFRFCWRLSSDRTCYGKFASSIFSVVIKHFNQIATVKCYSVSHWTH